MNVIRKFTKRIDYQKAIDALLILAIVVMAVVYKLNKIA
jgi:hypothetical protein